MRVQRPAGWTAAQREARCLVAARLFRSGQLTQAQIARTLGVSRAAVSQWHERWQRGGDRRLRSRATGHRSAKLSAREWRVLGRILDRGAVASGFDTEQWTLKRIAHVIERRFGVQYHYRYLERPLKAHGFSVQRTGQPGEGERRAARGRVAPAHLAGVEKKGAERGAHDRALG